MFGFPDSLCTDLHCGTLFKEHINCPVTFAVRVVEMVAHRSAFWTNRVGFDYFGTFFLERFLLPWSAFWQPFGQNTLIILC